MPTSLARLVDSRCFGAFARIALIFAFWGSGLSKLMDFPNGVAEMAHYGLEPAAAFNIASIATLLGGSALVILNRHAWLGCSALAVFMVMTIPIVHHFWAMSDSQEALIHFFFVTEHVSPIGALMVMTILSRRPRALPASLADGTLAPAQ